MDNVKKIDKMEHVKCFHAHFDRTIVGRLDFNKEEEVKFGKEFPLKPAALPEDNNCLVLVFDNLEKKFMIENGDATFTEFKEGIAINKTDSRQLVIEILKALEHTGDKMAIALCDLIKKRTAHHGN